MGLHLRRRCLRWDLGEGGRGHQLEEAPELGGGLDLERVRDPALGFPNRVQQIWSETGENDGRGLKITPEGKSEEMEPREGRGQAS